MANVGYEDFVLELTEREGIDISTVRSVLDSAAELIFDYATSIPPSEDLYIKPIKGLTISRKLNKNYCERGIVDKPNGAVSIRANVTDHLKKKIKQKIN